MSQWLVEYDYLGGKWSLILVANSRSDAEARLSHIASGEVLGELVSIVPHALGPLMKAAVWLRNTLKAKP